MMPNNFVLGEEGGRRCHDLLDYPQTRKAELPQFHCFFISQHYFCFYYHVLSLSAVNYTNGLSTEQCNKLLLMFLAIRKFTGQRFGMPKI